MSVIERWDPLEHPRDLADKFAERTWGPTQEGRRVYVSSSAVFGTLTGGVTPHGSVEVHMERTDPSTGKVISSGATWIDPSELMHDVMGVRPHGR